MTVFLETVLLSEVFGLSPGDRAALIGCGGKTSLMYRLARENRSHSVLIGTTTRILRPPREVYDREAAPDSIPRKSPGVTLFVSGEENSKLLPSKVSELAAAVAGFDYAFIECDGSRGLPLKGWADFEPVVPDFSTATIGVCTPKPVGKPLSGENTLRVDKFRELTGAVMGGAVTPAHISAMVSHQNGMFKNAVGRRILFINQAESDEDRMHSREIARLLPGDFKGRLSLIVSGSLRLGRFEILWEG